MPPQPLLYLTVFMRGVIVGNQMNLPVHRGRHIDQAQELKPLLVAMPLLAKANDSTGGGVHGGEQRRRAIAFVIVRQCLQSAGEQILAAGATDKELLELVGTFSAKTLGIEP